MSKEIPCPKCGHVWLWADWKKDKDAFCPKGRGCAREEKTTMSNDLRSLNSLEDIEFAVKRIDELEHEIKTLRKGLEIYKRERTRYKHAYPEMTGEFFISGSHGPKDDNAMPQFIEICPAYGAGWVMIYEDTGRTISYEGW